MTWLLSTRLCSPCRSKTAFRVRFTRIATMKPPRPRTVPYLEVCQPQALDRIAKATVRHMVQREYEGELVQHVWDPSSRRYFGLSSWRSCGLKHGLHRTALAHRLDSALGILKHVPREVQHCGNAPPEGIGPRSSMSVAAANPTAIILCSPVQLPGVST